MRCCTASRPARRSMPRDNTVRLPALPDANAPVDEVQRRESEARETQARETQARETQARESIAEKSVAKLLRLPRRTRDEREFLPAALEIVDTPPSPVGRAIGLTIIAVAVLAIAWACIGQIDIVASASG